MEGKGRVTEDMREEGEKVGGRGWEAGRLGKGDGGKVCALKRRGSIISSLLSS